MTKKICMDTTISTQIQLYGDKKYSQKVNVAPAVNAIEKKLKQKW